MLPPSIFLGYLAESTCSSPSIKQRVLSFHTPPREGRKKDLHWWVKREWQTVPWDQWKNPSTPGRALDLFPPGRLCGPPGWAPLQIQAGLLVSPGLISFKHDLLFVQYLPYNWYKSVLLQLRFFTARKENICLVMQREELILSLLVLM